MKNPFARFARARDKPNPQNAVSTAPSFSFGSSVSGKSVTASTAIQMSTVYACVRVIAETIASLPIHVYEHTDAGNRKATEHPLYRLLHDEPNLEMTSFVLRETMMAHLLLWGNSYCQIIRTGRDQVVSIHPLQPDQMAVDRDTKGNLTYTYTDSNGKQFLMKPEDVLHIPGLGFDGIVGYSPIAIEKNAVGLGIAAEEFGAKFFSNGARPSGVLTHPNTVKDPAALRASWNSAYGGSSNASRVAVLEEGMTFTPLSMPNNEAQFIETRRFQVEEICRIYRVPPHMVADLSRATFSNIEHSSIDFAIHTIRPWLVRMEQAMNRALIPETEKEDLLTMALQIDPDRRDEFCQPVDELFLQRLNRRRPATSEAFARLWYDDYDWQSRAHQHYDGTRYRLLNLHSVFQKGTIEFRAFNSTVHAGEVKSYIQLCLAISHKALESSGASPRRPVTDNPKYTFRCWLLRLGFIGDEFKTAREHLTKHLPGNSAWRQADHAS